VFKLLSVGAVNVAVSISDGASYSLGSISITNTVTVSGNTITASYITLRDTPFALVSTYGNQPCYNTVYNNIIVGSYCTASDNPVEPIS